MNTMSLQNGAVCRPFNIYISDELYMFAFLFYEVIGNFSFCFARLVLLVPTFHLTVLW